MCFCRGLSGFGRAADEQGFSLGYELLADLVGAPALPALQLSCRNQGCVYARFQFFVVYQTAMFFERLAQRGGGAVGVFAVAGLHGLLQQHHARFNGFCGGLALGGVNLGTRGGFFGGGFFACFGRQATGGADFIGPHRHGRQRGGGVLRGGAGLFQCGAEGVPHGGQLCLRGFNLRGVTQIHAGPVGVGLQGGDLFAPVVHISLQAGAHSIGVGPGLGGEQFNALMQQRSRFALHQRALLQIFQRLDAFVQLAAQAQQRLA